MSGPDAGGAGSEDRLSRVVAVGAVIATLLAGMVGFLLANASKEANDAGLRADRLGLHAMGELTRSLSRVEAEYQTFLLGEEQRTHETLSRQEAMFASGRARLRHDLAEQRWARLAARTEQLSTISFEGVDGPEKDPAFPERFFAAATFDAVRLAALQDAANEYQARWDKKVSAYVAILTVLGVALYLFALLSVSLQNDVKRLFATVGSVLLAAAVIWTTFVFAKPAELAPARAAEEFASGHTALASAHNRAAYVNAERHYTEAIRLRPTFARAFFERSKAVFLSGSPQSSGLSVVGPAQSMESATSLDALERSREDLLTTHGMGLNSSPVLGRLGFDTFMLGWQRDEPALFDESIAFTREAIALDPDEPVWRYHLGLALLAAGRYAEASEAYTQGIRHTLYVDPERKVRREDPRVEELLEAEALTNLQRLAASDDAELVRRTATMKERVVGAVSRGRLATVGSDTSVSGVRLDVSPSEAAFSIGRVRGFDPKRDVVSVQLYYDGGARQAGYVIPEASGVLEPRYLNGTVLPYLSTTTPPRCLPDGTYRLEVYVDGELTGQAQREAAFGHLHRAAAAPDLDLGMCVPAGWERSPMSQPGLVYGHQRPDGSRGAYLLRFDTHRGQAGLDSSRGFADTAVELLFGTEAAVTADRDLAQFGDLDQPVTRDYTVGGQAVTARAGIDDEGAAVVALVVGSESYLDGTQPAAILDSVFLYDPEDGDD